MNLVIIITHTSNHWINVYIDYLVTEESPLEIKTGVEVLTIFFNVWGMNISSFSMCATDKDFIGFLLFICLI